MDFSSREREALAELFDALGPDEPTLCEGWTTAHLAAHLVVREHRPDSLPGFGVEATRIGGPLPAWSHRLEDRLRTSTPYPEIVRRFRDGPPPWSPMAWPGGRALNLTEFAIHHEDVRRAQPDWTVRPLPRQDQDALWRAVQLVGRRGAGRKGAVLRRSDAPGSEKRFGPGGRTLEGEPLELLLWLSGRRDAARVTQS